MTGSHRLKLLISPEGINSYVRRVKIMDFRDLFVEDKSRRDLVEDFFYDLLLIRPYGAFIGIAVFYTPDRVRGLMAGRP